MDLQNCDFYYIFDITRKQNANPFNGELCSSEVRQKYYKMNHKSNLKIC
jgi:hypothetical protein